MAYFIKGSPQLQDYVTRTERVCIPFTINGNATPASKTYSIDVPQAMVLSTQGLTATAAAIDSACNFTSAQDASSAVFGVLLYNLGTVQKVLRASFDNVSTQSISVTLNGASSTGVTASGNIALSGTWASTALTSGSPSATFTCDYLISGN